jgi:hypothetical protein
MRKRLVLAVMLFVSIYGFAAQKSVKETTPSTGILILSPFSFNIAGDGISTTFIIAPWRIPQGGNGGNPALPQLPLLGMFGTGNCDSLVFTGTVFGDRLTVTFQSPPPANTLISTCTALLLFQPH